MSNELAAKKNRSEAFLIITIFLLNLFLIMPKLQPSLLAINPNDGAKYIESGRILFEWGLRNLAWGPLVALIYAPIHLIVGNSPNWFMLEVWIGNYILFGLLWLSFYALARQLDKYISKYVIIGLLFVLTVYFPILENQSDALFIPLSVIALLFLIRFLETDKLKNLWLASLFVGLGVLCRFEAILLVITLTGFALAYGLKKHKVVKLLLAAWVPVAAVLAIFFIINLITFGGLNIGADYKSYDSFQMNQAFLPGSANGEAYARGEEIFGTFEENEGSIFRAMLRNPLATGERVLANILILPDLYFEFFGKLQGPLLLIFSLLGLFHLIREKATKIWLPLLIWPVHAFVALIFLTRHIIPQMSYVFIILSAIGLTYMLKKATPNVLWKVLLGLSALIIGLSILTHKYAFLSVGILLLVAALAALLDHNSEGVNIRLMPAMILLIGLLFFSGLFSFPSFNLGENQDEVGAQQIMAALPENANVLTPYHTVAIAGKTNSFLLPSTIGTPEQLLTFLEEGNFQGVYMDAKVRYPSDVVMETVAQYPEAFELYYQSEDGNIRLYLVLP